MVKLYDSGVYLVGGKQLIPENEAQDLTVSKADARKGTQGRRLPGGTGGNPEQSPCRVGWGHERYPRLRHRRSVKELTLSIAPLTNEEKEIIRYGSLINYSRMLKNADK